MKVQGRDFSKDNGSCSVASERVEEVIDFHTLMGGDTLQNRNK
jgi:hypothetical protein